MLALTLAVYPSRALAGPADLDEPLLHPRLEIDPRLDLPEPARSPRPGSLLRAPLWFAIDASLLRRDTGAAGFGAMLLMGVPLDRLAMRAIGEGTAPDPPSLKPDRKPPDPPPATKLPPAPASALPPPLRVPVVVTPEAAREAVSAALKRAHLAEPDARLDGMATRARSAAALPELRLRALRTVDQGQTLSPTEYDPLRTTATAVVSYWMEARATWRLDRLVFADEEVAIERMRHDRAEARTKLTAHVLKLLFEWQRALALADNPAASPEENLTARLKALEAEAEIDLITDGWLTRWKAARP